MIHTGVRAYACPVCKKDFITKANQKRHYVKHNCSTSELNNKQRIMKDNSMDVFHRSRNDSKEPEKKLSGVKSQLDLSNTLVSVQELSQFQEMVHKENNKEKPRAFIKPLQKVDTFMEIGMYPYVKSNEKVSNESNNESSDLQKNISTKIFIQSSEKKIMKTVHKTCNNNKRQACQTNFKSPWRTLIINKEAAIAAVKSINIVKKVVVMKNILVLNSILTEIEQKTQCRLIFNEAAL